MDDRELVKKSLEGDEETFTTLVLQNRDGVYRHCLSIVHDAEIAEDLTQETFVHAFQHLGSFRMESRFSTWLWRIAHNLSLSYLKRHPRNELEFKEEALSSPFHASEEISDERLSHIQEALESLDPKQRIVFELYDLQHISQKQIAQDLGIPHGTVRSRLHYARKAIRRFLQGA